MRFETRTSGIKYKPRTPVLDARRKTAELAKPVVYRDRGDYSALNDDYNEHDVVRTPMGVWICNASTMTAPAIGNDKWTLVAMGTKEIDEESLEEEIIQFVGTMVQGMSKKLVGDWMESEKIASIRRIEKMLEIESDA